MVNHLYRDPAFCRAGERARSVTVERLPGFAINFRLQGRLQGAIGIIRSQEIGVADKEAFLVVIGVNEPARDPIGVIADHLAGLWLEDVHTANIDLDLALLSIQNLDIRLAEYCEEISLPGILEVLDHV